MDIRHPRISALFEQTCRELAAGGVTPSPADCVWLHALCSDVVMGDRPDVCVWMPPAAQVGPVTLYELTIQARLWLENYAGPWWREDELMDLLSTSYAMANGRVAGAFADLTIKARAEVAVAKWFASVPVTVDQLKEGLLRLFGTDDTVAVPSPIEGKPDPVEWGEVIARCVHESGQSPEAVMLWTTGQIASVLRASHERDGTQVDKAKIRALEALRLAKETIRGRGK